MLRLAYHITKVSPLLSYKPIAKFAQEKESDLQNQIGSYVYVSKYQHKDDLTQEEV